VSHVTHVYDVAPILPVSDGREEETQVCGLLRVSVCE